LNYITIEAQIELGSIEIGYCIYIDVDNKTTSG